MQVTVRHSYTTIKTEGAILPADLLQRIGAGDGVEGLTPADYHLAPNEKLNEAINRAWNRCLGAWTAFDDQRHRLPLSDMGTTLTRERWLLILFQELGYGRLQYSRGLPLGDVSYPISHIWGRAPIHLVTFRQELDRRGDGSGMTARSPHSLMQEFLNRSPEHLWGFISNGLQLRILRDNRSLTRAAYVEFDLEAMMAGELYADFSLLWLVCHQSRIEGDRPAACWLERWCQAAAEQGTRALDSLRDGVQEAIAALGRGFLAHPANSALIADLRAGELTKQGYYRQLLRLVYRLIFLFVAEDRGLLLVPGAPAEAQRRYQDYYSLQRLRELAGALRGGPHPDHYRSLRLVFAALRQGYAPLGLPALGSFLFSERATPNLDEAEIANSALLEAIRALAFTIEGNVRRPVDYRNLGSEELGSVYESLLELHPEINADHATFALNVAAGSERKTTGSYYTPRSLINALLDSALEPVVADRLSQAMETAKRNKDAQDRQDRKRFPSYPSLLPPSGPATGQADRDAQDSRDRGPSSCVSCTSLLPPSPLEEAILSIKVVDPACGSGHFLIAAAHRLARHLAQVRSGDDEPSPGELRAALRDVVSRCIHGVDINEMAVELCKVGLWLETLDPGKPLSFLERNIQCGNSLIGATPALLEEGIPDEAFKPIEGDDRAYCSTWRKRNKQERQERERQDTLFDVYTLQPWERLGDLAAGMMSLEAIAEDTVDDVQRKQALYEELVRSDGYQYGRRWADAWCAAFMWKKTKEFAYPITEGIFRQVERNPHNLVLWMKEEIARLREQYQFFHWHLAFPHVFRVPGRGEAPENEQAGWSGGFDVVLGNPPWEHVELKEKEWFAARRPDIAAAPSGAERKQLIRRLAREDTVLHEEFLEAKRQHDAVSHFLGDSGYYPLCGRGRINTYAVFAELVRNLQCNTGRAGIIVPSGIATDNTTKFYFQGLMERQALVSLYDFENRQAIFPGVHRSYKFCLLTLTGPGRPAQAGAEFVFFAQATEDLADPERRFTLSAEEIALLNPNTRTCPIFRNRRDAELTKAIYRRVPVLIREGPPEENPWAISFKQGLFNMTSDSGLFRTREQLEEGGWELSGNVFQRDARQYLPLYEAKMASIYDHRAAHVTLSPTAVIRQGQPDRISPEGHRSPTAVPTPRYWADASDVDQRLGSYKGSGLLGFTDVTSATNERTMLATVLPRVGVGHTMPLVLVPGRAAQLLSLISALDSFAFDYAGRQKLGGVHYTYFILKQLPVPPPATYGEPCGWAVDQALNDWIASRAMELTYTAWDLQPFAQDCGYDGPPFRWDVERRFLLRCELDAAYFHLYGIARSDVDHIMETFPIVKRKDEAAYGEYRTKRVILEVYDAMQRAMDTGEPYQTLLDPPPADPRVAHPPHQT